MKKTIFFTSFIISFCLIILSCTVGPDYKQTEIFSDPEIKKALDLKPSKTKPFFISLENINDPILKKLIQKAHENNPDIRIALTQLRQSRAYLRMTMTDALPEVNAQASYNYLKESQNTQSFLKEEYYQLGFDASWEIDIFGYTRRQTEAAKAQVKASIASLKNISVSLESETAQNYINYRMTQQLLKNAEENLLLQSDIYQTVLEKYTAGLADQIDLKQAEYLKETIQMEIPSLKTQKTAYANALSLLVGQLPKALNKELENNQENLILKTFSFNVKDIYLLPADTIKNRPDVQIAEENLIAQNASVGVAIAHLFPKISLSALVGFEAVRFPNLLQNNSFTYNIVPGVQMPLFNFGALRQNIELQKAKKEELLISYEQTMLQAASEIQNAMTALAQEYNRNISARQAFSEMQEAYELMIVKYKQGLIDYSTLLEAEINRLKAQTEMIQSNGNLLINFIGFYKAIGGSVSQKPQEQAPFKAV